MEKDTANGRSSRIGGFATGAPTVHGAAAEAERLAIVVPTLDEEETLRRNLAAARAIADELVVSDGGSTDATRAVARALGARVVTGPRGRGGQLNRGAAATTAPLLLFLHADTRLPPGAARRIREAVAGGADGGAFTLRFDSRHPLLRFGARMITLRTRLTRTPLGDQAQYVTRAAFERLDGFREWPILEDLDFALRLRRSGTVAILSPPVVTASRRFQEQGMVRTVAANWLIWALFWAGVSPHRLARLYPARSPASAAPEAVSASGAPEPRHSHARRAPQQPL